MPHSESSAYVVSPPTPSPGNALTPTPTSLDFTSSSNGIRIHGTSFTPKKSAHHVFDGLLLMLLELRELVSSDVQ